MNSDCTARTSACVFATSTDTPRMSWARCSLDHQPLIWRQHNLGCSGVASFMGNLISISRDDPFARYSTTCTLFSYWVWLLSQPPRLSWWQDITPLHVPKLPEAADGQLCSLGWHLLSRQNHPSTESCSHPRQLLGYIFIRSQAKYLRKRHSGGFRGGLSMKASF